MSSWSIVTTVRAPEWQVNAFIKHYLEIGAKEIFLYFDDPAFSLELMNDRVKCIVCTEEYWGRKRPEGLEDRQRFNATKAKDMTSAEWIMHCDIDELCWSAIPISEVLSEQHEGIGGVMVSPREAIYSKEPTNESIYSTHFFKRFGDEAEPKTYKRIAEELFPTMAPAGKCGIWGHVQGKSFIKKEANSGRMPLHHKKNDIPGFEMRSRTDKIILRHYDTMSYSLWRDKHMRRIFNEVLVPNAGKFRQKQQEYIMSAFNEKGDDGIRSVYTEMSVLAPDLLVKGIESGFICVIPPESHLNIINGA